MSTEIANPMAPENRQALIATLQNSLYVGCKPESIEMVIAYCGAAELDIMQKPVHIVPISVKDSATGNYAFRDVIMPGIGLYRIQANRSGTLAGSSEPEFGPDITQTFIDKNDNQVEMTYPEWCKVTMKKIVATHTSSSIVDFVAKEYWVENYATDSSRSTAPNAMWKKRPRGQLAKCAEAQALRKGWPEIGQAATAEEMEGKVLDMGNAEIVHDVETVAGLPLYPADQFEANAAKWKQVIASGAGNAEGLINKLGTKYMLSADQIDTISKWEVSK